MITKKSSSWWFGIDRHKFHYPKSPALTDDIDIDKILIPGL